jgi:hypothetical protein
MDFRYDLRRFHRTAGTGDDECAPALAVNYGHGTVAASGTVAANR